MRCATTESLLIDYHFALGEKEQLAELHAHLRDCRDCAPKYLDLKYAIDSGAALGVRPAAKTRARLRAEVGAMFRPALPRRIGQWLGRPVPRYQVAAVAASGLFLAAALAVLGLRGPAGPGEPVLAHRQDRGSARSFTDRARRHDYEAVDTARPMAVSLTYY